MARTRTPRMNLWRWSSEADTQQRSDFDESAAEIEDRAAIYGQGTLAGKGAADAANEGKFWIITDAAGGGVLGDVYYSDGVSWSLIGGIDDLRKRLFTAKGNLAMASAAGVVGALPLSGTRGAGLVEDPAAPFGADWKPVVSALGIYQPENFGAIGDNLTDNLAAINACIAAAVAAGGGQVRFGGGIFRTSGSHLVNADNVSIYGVLGATRIRTTHASLPVFDLGDNVTIRSFLGLSELIIDSSVARTGGAFIRARKTALLKVDRCRLDGAYYGVDLLDTQVTALVDLHIINCKPGVGEAIRADSTGTGSNLFLHRIATDAPAGAQPRCGLSMKRWDGLFLTDTQFNHSGYGAIFEPPSGFCDHIWASNCSFDTGTGDGVLFNAAGGQTRKVWMLGCWFGTNDGNGMSIAGNTIAVSLVQPKLINNAQHGLAITNGADIELVSPQIAGNSRGSAGTFDGILIAANMGRIKVLGGRIGPFAGYANTQRRAVTITAGAGDFITFDNVDCDGNVNAVGISNGATGVNVSIRNCRGYKTANKGTAVQGSGAASIGVGHGLAVTPTLADIAVTPCSDIGAASKFWITNVTSSGFDIVTNAAPGAAVTWSWQVDAGSAAD